MTTSKSILVVHAGRYGSTAEVAEAIADELRSCGATVESRPARDVFSIESYDAVVVGSAVYSAKWLPEAMRFVETNHEGLSRRRVAYFTLCMELTRVPEDQDREVPVFVDPELGQPPRVEGKLGYFERTHLLSAILQPVLDAAPGVEPLGVGVFRGKLEYRGLRFVDWLTVKLTWWLFKRAPEGDYRNWEAIRSWAAGLGSVLLP